MTAPYQWGLTSSQMIGVKDCGNNYGDIYKRIGSEPLPPYGLRGAVYRNSECNPENSGIELIVGIQEKERADRILKERMCARTIHKGGYSSLPDAYGALVAWIEKHGYEWDGEPYEIYRKTKFDCLAPEDGETEVYFPIRK